MKLYAGPLSLFSKKVEIALHEKGLSFERVLVPFDQRRGYEPKHPTVLELNPKAQVPVLVDAALELFDSTLILEYLEDAYPEPALYPDGAAARARCRLLELYADDVMLVPLRALMHRTGPRPDDPSAWQRSEDAAGEATARLDQQFARIDRDLEGRNFLCARFSVADIAVFMAVLFGRRLGGPGMAAHANLARWYAALSERPAFARVTDEIVAADAALSAPVAGAYRD